MSLYNTSTPSEALKSSYDSFYRPKDFLPQDEESINNLLMQRRQLDGLTVKYIKHLYIADVKKCIDLLASARHTESNVDLALSLMFNEDFIAMHEWKDLIAMHEWKDLMSTLEKQDGWLLSERAQMVLQLFFGLEAAIKIAMLYEVKDRYISNIRIHSHQRGCSYMSIEFSLRHNNIEVSTHHVRNLQANCYDDVKDSEMTLLAFMEHIIERGFALAHIVAQIARKQEEISDMMNTRFSAFRDLIVYPKEPNDGAELIREAFSEARVMMSNEKLKKIGGYNE